MRYMIPSFLGIRARGGFSWNLGRYDRKRQQISPQKNQTLKENAEMLPMFPLKTALKFESHSQIINQMSTK